MKSKKMKLRMLFMMIAVVCFIGLIGCSDSQATNNNDNSDNNNDGKNSKTYKVGALLPLTGKESDFGNDVAAALQMGIDSVNKDGGVNGVPLQLVTEDSAADPNKAITGFRKLNDVDKVPVIASAWSTVVNAMAPLAEENKQAILSVGATSPKIKDLGHYTRTFSFLADYELEGLLKYTYDKLEARDVAVLFSNNDTGKDSAVVYKNGFEKLGGNVVAYESITPGATDFTAQISKVKAAKPDVIFMQANSNEIPFLLKQIRGMGMNVPITSIGGWVSEGMIDLVGEAAEGFLGTAYTKDLSDPVMKAYNERWKEEKGKESVMISLSALFTDSAYLIRDVYKKIVDDGKEINGENFIAALDEIKEFNTPLTGTTIFEEDRSTKKDIMILEIKDGKVVLTETVPMER